jgi:hypothetical protein
MLRDAWTHDRRRGDRRLVSFLLEAHIDGAESPARVRELGVGGMVVQAARAWPAGAIVSFSLGSGAEATGRMEGHVAHSRLMLSQRHEGSPVYFTGVAFARVTPDQVARVAAWLAAIDQRGSGRSTVVP